MIVTDLYLPEGYLEELDEPLEQRACILKRVYTGTLNHFDHFVILHYVLNNVYTLDISVLNRDKFNRLLFMKGINSVFIDGSVFVEMIIRKNLVDLIDILNVVFSDFRFEIKGWIRD